MGAGVTFLMWEQVRDARREAEEARRALKAADKRGLTLVRQLNKHARHSPLSMRPGATFVQA